jgi:hypothetical protein
MAIFTAGTWGPGANSDRITTPVNSDQRDIQVQFNTLLTNLSTFFANLTGDSVLIAGAPSIGTTVTLASAAQTIIVNGVTAALAAETAKAFGALGTIPTAKWGVIGVERILAGTTSFTSGAANYTTGYATEALAIAALPAQTANKVLTGYITILATTPGWVAGTDALEGGTGGTPATTTNYYTTASILDTSAFTAKQIANPAGDVLTSILG